MTNIAAPVPSSSMLSAKPSSITTPGTNVQLYQRGIEVHAGVTYSGSFTGRNVGGNDVRLRLIDHRMFNVLGLDERVDLTGTDRTYSFDFTVPVDSANARLQFWIAPFDEAGNDYFFDSVSIEEVCGSTLSVAQTR